MTYTSIVSEIKTVDLEDGNAIFAVARKVAAFFQNPGTDVVEGRDLIIRLVDRRTDFERKLKGVGRMIDALAREAGLHPYVDNASHWSDQLAIDVLKAPGLDKVTFHIEQALIFKKLAEGESIILSAPTSFGKSLIVDSLIYHKRPKIVIAIVPTIALLDEYRRRLSRRFPDYQIITSNGEAYQGSLAIYIGTQERILERGDISDVDLFVIDEFYKLDLERRDDRAYALNAVLARFGKRAKQIYLIGPSIDDVPNAQSFRDDLRFYRTKFTPVAADIIDRTDASPTPERLIADLHSVGGESSLIYVRSPKSAYTLSYDVASANIGRSSDFCVKFADWLGENFHPQWALCDALREGIAFHHGRVPRAIAQIIISLFNSKEINTIICTSSMIEGINTAARNVFIYDRHISMKKLDRFTFDNIKGRAGRMFQHKVGRIFLYNQPPEALPFDVRVPLFDDQDRLAPELLVQLQDDILTPQARARKRFISDTSKLPPDLLQRWAEYGIDELNLLAEEIAFKLEDGPNALFWRGYPDYANITAVFDLSWGLLDFNKHDLRSAKQAAFFAVVLRKQPTLRRFMDRLVRGSGLSAQRDIDLCFNFLRGADHTFPQLFRASHEIINHVAGTEIVDYSAFAVGFQNYFHKNECRYLDEYGVPFPIAAKLSLKEYETSRDLLSDISLEASAARNRLSDLERMILNRGLG